MVTAVARFVPSSLLVDALMVEDDGITIRAVSDAARARCPLCGERADRVHSRVLRILADLPRASVVGHLRVQVRKFFCDNPGCPRRIFSERLSDVALPHARRTVASASRRAAYCSRP